MIPLRDDVRMRRFPLVTVLLVIANLAVFAYEILLQGSGGDPALNRFINDYGLVPARVAAHPGLATWWTFISSMFLHGGLLHFGGNMLYLWIFGNNVEDVMGSFWYTVFYFATGFAASWAQLQVSQGSTVAGIGASGAIAGVLAAYLMYFPGARIATLIFLGIFTTIRSLPAVIVLGLWFVLQLFSGVASVGQAQIGGVAYFAHIGGFLAGLALALPWVARARRMAKTPFAR